MKTKHDRNLVDIEVSLGSHTLIIVEADGSPIKPHSVSSMMISPGQRYSFYVEYDDLTPIKAGESFWMRTRLNEEDFNMASKLYVRHYESSINGLRRRSSVRYRAILSYIL